MVGLGLSVHLFTVPISPGASISILEDAISNMVTDLPHVSNKRVQTSSEVSVNQLEAANEAGLAGLESVDSLADLERNLIE